MSATLTVGAGKMRRRTDFRFGRSGGLRGFRFGREIGIARRIFIVRGGLLSIVIPSGSEGPAVRFKLPELCRSKIKREISELGRIKGGCVPCAVPFGTRIRQHLSPDSRSGLMNSVPAGLGVWRFRLLRRCWQKRARAPAPQFPHFPHLHTSGPAALCASCSAKSGPSMARASSINC